MPCLLITRCWADRFFSVPSFDQFCSLIDAVMDNVTLTIHYAWPVYFRFHFGHWPPKWLLNTPDLIIATYLSCFKFLQFFIWCCFVFFSLPFIIFILPFQLSSGHLSLSLFLSLSSISHSRSLSLFLSLSLLYFSFSFSLSLSL